MFSVFFLVIAVVGLQERNAIFLESNEGLRERETGRGADDAASRKRCVYHGGDVVCARGMRVDSCPA